MTLYAPVPGIFFDSFPSSNGSLCSDLFTDKPVFSFYFYSASLILYSPTPGLPLLEEINLSIFGSI